MAGGTEFVIDPHSTEMDVLETNLVLLLAIHLDEAELKTKSATKTPNAWKTNTLLLCAQDKLEIRAFLRPYLQSEEDEDGSEVQTGPKASAEPLKLWFDRRAEEGDPMESRVRSNAMRAIIAKLVTEGGPEVYDSRVRHALKQTARDLKLNWGTDIAPMESVLFAERIGRASSQEAGEAPPRAPSESGAWNPLRVAQVITAGVVGGTVIGITGGAAAPIIAPVLASLFAVTTTAAVSAGIISGVFGIMGAGLASYKMSDRTNRTLSEFDILDCNLRDAPVCVDVLIGVSGYYPADRVEDRLRRYWAEASSGGGEFDCRRNVFAVKFESQAICNYSYTVSEMLRAQAISYTSSELLKFVVGATVMLPISLMNYLDVINNSFAVCVSKAYAAGVELATALQSRYQGYRPITLCGFGFGALAIFHCLERLADLGAAGIVENAVLACCPVRAGKQRWAKAQTIVAGSIYNCYAPSDWSLQVAMRAAVSLDPIAGVQPVGDVPGVVNVQIDTTHAKLGMDNGELEIKRLLLHTLSI